MKHWWLKKNKFERVRMATLYRLGLLYMAETGKDASSFLLWLTKYIVDVDETN